MSVCASGSVGASAHERKLKMVGNNICVVVSFLNGSIQNLSIRHATFLISNSYVRYVNKLLRIFAHIHTHTQKYINTHKHLYGDAPMCARQHVHMYIGQCVCV